jgi:hypothetical protein
MSDKIIKYKTVYTEEDNLNMVKVKIQYVKRESGREAIQAYIPLTRINVIHGCVSLTFTYKEMKAIYKELVKLRGKEEVNKEIGVKI